MKMERPAARRRPVSSTALPLLLVMAGLEHMAVAFYPSAVAAVPRCQSSSGSSRFASAIGGVDVRSGGGSGARGMGVMSISVAPPRTKAEKSDEFFRAKGRMVEFGSSQRVEASISGAKLASMEGYLSDPARIVYACWEHDDIIPMGDGVFRMKFSGQSFLSVSIDMSVDIKLWPGEAGKIQCESVGFSAEDMAKILGQEFVDSFYVELKGELRVEESETKVRALTLKNTLLNGDVRVTVGGKMPALLAATPEPLVRSAALGINQKVLEYVSSTFVSTVARDYRQWARDQKQDSLQQ